MTVLIALGFNRTGMDSGELDYSIAVARVMNLSDKDFDEMMLMFDEVKKIVQSYRNTASVVGVLPPPQKSLFFKDRLLDFIRKEQAKAMKHLKWK